MSNGSICYIDRTLSGSTTRGQREPRNNGNEGVLHVPQSSKTGALPDGLMSYLGHSLGEAYSSAHMQSVYSTAPADWAEIRTRPFVSFNESEKEIPFLSSNLLLVDLLRWSSVPITYCSFSFYIRKTRHKMPTSLNRLV